jgi:hypothetical protein
MRCGLVKNSLNQNFQNGFGGFIGLYSVNSKILQILIQTIKNSSLLNAVLIANQY